MQGANVSEQLTRNQNTLLKTEGEKKPDTRRAILPGETAPGKVSDVWDWQWQMRHRVTTRAALCRALPGLRGDKLIEPVLARYPMAISPYYLSLIQEPDPSDPIFRQCVPQPEELQSPPYCAPDPLQEEKHSPVPQLIHRYQDRALSLASSTCATNCRHCTRKRMAGVREGFISPSTLACQAEYLRRHPEVGEVIISGGDPLTMPTTRLAAVFAAFRSIPTVRIIRVGTRVPVTMPMRITEELCSALQEYHPVWLCTHFNHPREITPESALACERLLRAGVPILNQTVLLRGVNDSPETMIELCRALLSIRVRPYYLYQCDLVQGVEHFRTPLARGIEIAEAIRGRVGGIGVPRFIVDAPEGGGKIPVGTNHIVEMSRARTLLRNTEGAIIAYPEPADVSDTRESGAFRMSASAGNKIRRGRVALVYNLKTLPLSVTDSEAEYDSPETIGIIARSIESLGHSVVRIEATRELPVKLASADVDVVFNIAEGSGERGREARVPAVCEMMELAYTGSDQTTLAIALDKALTKTVLMQTGISTPPFRLVRSLPEAENMDLTYPVIVKPNHEGSSVGLLPDSVAWTADEVMRLIERVLTRYAQPAIVEECLPGREFTVGFLGPGEPEALPLLEICFLDPSRAPIYDVELKQDPPDKVRHVCPSMAHDSLAGEIIGLARRAYHALECRDIGRVDVRLDRNGRPQVLEVNPLPGLAPCYSDICKMTEALGWSHAELISRILAPALSRSHKPDRV